jgi:hypothetical protein
VSQRSSLNGNKYEYICTNNACREVFYPADRQPDTAECPACKGFLKMVRSPAVPPLEPSPLLEGVDMTAYDEIVSDDWGPEQRIELGQYTLTCPRGCYKQTFFGEYIPVAVLCPKCSEALLPFSSEPSSPKQEQPTTQHYIAERGPTHGESYPLAANYIQWLKEKAEFQPNWDRLDGDQKESLHMIFTKIGRILHGDVNYLDHWQDIAGYATLVLNRLREDKVVILEDNEA